MFAIKFIIALVALVTLAGCTSSGSNGPASQPTSEMGSDNVVVGDTAPSNTNKQITVSLSEFAFSPGALTLTKGEAVDLVLSNTGTVRHTFTIPGLNIDDSLAPGENKTISATAPATGKYELLCTIPGHKERGMVGQVEVR